MLFSFSISRTIAVIRKEFIQMRRDRMTFGMMIGIPIIQLILFGFAINSNPKHLPAAVISMDNGPFTRNFLTALQVSEYFDINIEAKDVKHARKLLKEGVVKFVISIPPDFSKSLLRGEKPSVLIEADATDPMSIGNALDVANYLVRDVFNKDLRSANFATGNRDLVKLVVHRNFNPEIKTQYNTVPGLLGVILTLTMVFITALAITREMERGTMENLLSMPVRPLEVMIGKIVPYILVGYIQVILILIGGVLIFKIPIEGSLLLLFFVTLFFIAANLAVGVTFSTIARNQLQAVQMSIFFFLPSILLSGFMFPFLGMPKWAQWIGSILPLTHFNPIIRGILLKGSGFVEVAHHFWCIIIFLIIALAIGVFRYRQTLD